MISPQIPRRLAILICSLALVLAPVASASPTGSIAGFVKDQSGANISGAKLTLINVSTNAKEEAVSDSNGGFQFLQLAPAVYSLHVEAPGFKKEVVNDVLVQVDQITHLDATLQIGSLAETLEVLGEATPLLESDRSTLSNVIDSQVISDMPLNARQYLDLALLTPGVLPSSAGTRVAASMGPGLLPHPTFFLLAVAATLTRKSNLALAHFAYPVR